ncbi:hypothetical protein E2320_014848 [Naja naja]|nr:hypothetical protein E2320_014848 [Naja naja]
MEKGKEQNNNNSGIEEKRTMEQMGKVIVSDIDPYTQCYDITVVAECCRPIKHQTLYLEKFIWFVSADHSETKASAAFPQFGVNELPFQFRWVPGPDGFCNHLQVDEVYLNRTNLKDLLNAFNSMQFFWFTHEHARFLASTNDNLFKLKSESIGSRPLAPPFPPQPVPMQQAGAAGAATHTIPDFNQLQNLGGQLMPIEVQQCFTQLIRQGLTGGTQQDRPPVQVESSLGFTHRSKHHKPPKQSAVLQPYSPVSSEEEQSDYSVEEGEIETLSEEETEPEKSGFRGIFRPHLFKPLLAMAKSATGPNGHFEDPPTGPFANTNKQSVAPVGGRLEFFADQRGQTTSDAWTPTHKYLTSDPNNGLTEKRTPKSQANASANASA